MSDFVFDRICAKIDLDALSLNIENIRKRTPRDTGIVAVMKANAYGHGSVFLADFLNDKIDMAAVACIKEGIELRTKCKKFNKPILVLGYTAPEMFESAIENDITLSLFDFESARKMNETAEKLGKHIKVHLVVDTGMRRIGFMPDEDSIKTIVDISNDFKSISIEGIFTHFATADTNDQTFVEVQYSRFVAFVEKLKSNNVDVGLVHLSNSALIMQDREKFNLVRAGIVLYGLYPSEEVDKTALDLKPVMTFATRVENVFTLKKGEGISYGLTYIAEKNITVATLSCGYADGVFRSLSNKGYVLIHGKNAKILGRVCMDQMMVDVSDIPNVKQQDEAVIFGKQILEDGTVVSLSIEEVSELAGSFNYEMICDISRRVPRVYYENGIPVAFCDFLEKNDY